MLRFYTLSGRRIFYVDDLHKSYGDVVRIGPSEVAIADLAGVPQIHKTGSGFLKSNFYAKLTTAGTMREPGIFAMQNAQQHASRRRLFSRAFSNSSLKGNWEGEIRLKTKAAVDRIEEIAREPGKGVDILKWWTLMATDMITHLSFGESFGMLEQGKVRYVNLDDLVSNGTKTRLENVIHRSIRSSFAWGCPSFRVASSARLASTPPL